MDVIEQLQGMGKIEPVGIADMQVPEEIIYNEIIRYHLVFFIIGGCFTLLMVLL